MKILVAPPNYGKTTVSTVPSATNVAGVNGLGKPAGSKPAGIDTGVKVRRGRS